MIGTRLKELRLSKGYNMRQMASALNLPYTTYVNYEKGERKPSSELLVLIAKYFDVTVDYIVGRDVSTTPDLSGIKGIMPIPSMRKVPLLGSVACGKPIYKPEDDWIQLPSDVKADFCLRCQGDSMINARILDGDIVFIKQAPTVDNGEIAAVSVDNEVTLKRVYYYPDKGKLVLMPENTSYEPYVYIGEELNDIRILGRAVAFLSPVK